jgi:lipoprotein-anchoring transpeptidase ErfK/SrfK
MLGALVAAAGLACAAAPAAERTLAIAPGVTIGGIGVGGLTSEPARTRIAAALARPIAVVYRSEQRRIDPRRLGARLDVDAAVSAALAATPGSRIALPVRFSSKRIDAAVAVLARRYDRPAVPPKVIGATSAGPQFSAAKPGLAVDGRAMRSALERSLASAQRAPVQLALRTVPARRTVATFGLVIVITRGANTLELYDGRRLVRTFPVATGQAIYPTPAGVWQIADKQRDPWWYPPTYDAWAKGLKPVPPGPGNPLGTRWMGLNAAGVGIHGTDADTSIGYSVSHGCIRMHVPDAEWLFEHVHVGTPVVIL